MKFYIKPKHFAHKRSFMIKDDGQNNLFRIKGKFLLGLKTLTIQDMNSQKLYETSKRSAFNKYKLYDITNEKGEKVASIKRSRSLFKPKFMIEVNGTTLTIKGSLYQHSFSINDDTSTLASMSKQVFSFGDAYEIDVITEKNPLLHLFIMVTIDQFLHERKKSFTE